MSKLDLIVRNMKFKLLYALALLTLVGCSEIKERQDVDFTISEGWKVQSSKVVDLSGKVLSTDKFPYNINWYEASVPSTVLGTLTENGLFDDAFIGKNYEKVIDRDLFEPSWWYVTEFDMPILKQGQRIILDFEGISYRADVWLNGIRIASKEELEGPFRQFKFDVTDLIEGKNRLAVEVFRAQDGDFNIGFVDWNPRAADESMGIFRPVWIRYSDAVSVSNSAVRSKVDTENLDKAWLTVETTLKNMAENTITGTLLYSFRGDIFKKEVSLGAGEEKTVVVDSDDTDMLYVKNPRLWWCHNLGSPEMYEMSVSFSVDGKESDCQKIDFGIRQIESYMTPEGHRGFILNGRKVLVKGAGWTDDLFLRNPDERNEIELEYVKDMNMNAVRFENVWGTSHNVYDLCDRKGLLALVGWSCFWEWEVYSRTPNDQYGCIKSEEDMNLIAESFKDQILWLRNHPSIIAWYAGSDMLPRPELEKKYIDILERIDDRPYVGAAKALISEVTGPTGMKMVGPYDYQAPVYWYSPEAPGGSFGFNTETGIGAQMPMKESILKMIPEDKLWPLGDTYDYHCTTAGEAMHSLDVLKEVTDKRYGKSDNLDDFLQKAHHLDYDGTRAMFEGFRVNSKNATGIIQWMLNSAWPSLYWQMYDWYLVPTAGYWSVKKACQPQQLVYNYYDKSVYCVNDEIKDFALKAHMELLDADGKSITNQYLDVCISAGASVKLFDVPKHTGISFLFLSLQDESGNEVANNVYLLSSVEDIHDWNNYNWIRIPLLQHADYKPLSRMAKATVDCNVAVKNGLVTVTLNNTSDKVAFFVRMMLKDADGNLVIPAFWNDNFVSLKPCETRVYTCRVKDAEQELHLDISGWNVEKSAVILND